MVRAIKVMLIPNNVQKTKMFQYAGASRFAYNWALAREKESYEKGGKFISDSELRKEFTKLRHSDEDVYKRQVIRQYCAHLIAGHTMLTYRKPGKKGGIHRL